MKNLFLKDENNDTLAEVSIYNDEDNLTYLLGNIDIKNYSNFLLKCQGRKNEIINDFDFIYNISDWFLYKYIESKIDYTIEELEQEVEKIMKGMAMKFRLDLVK